MLGRFAHRESCLGDPCTSLSWSVVEVGGEMQGPVGVTAAVVLLQLGGDPSMVVCIAAIGKWNNLEK